VALGKAGKWKHKLARLLSTTHDAFRYDLMLANDGELDGKQLTCRTPRWTS
jgi:hypothetical protein